MSACLGALLNVEMAPARLAAFSLCPGYDCGVRFGGHCACKHWALGVGFNDVSGHE